VFDGSVPRYARIPDTFCWYSAAVRRSVHRRSTPACIPIGGGTLTVNSQSRHPLYRLLIEARPLAQVRPDSHFRRQLECYGFGAERYSDVLWNFEKFLVDRRGSALARFAPDVPPDDPSILAAIDERLAQP
jgi:hypothetical protein